MDTSHVGREFPYLPKRLDHRIALAKDICCLMERSNFERMRNPLGDKAETVFTFSLRPSPDGSRREIRVYSAIYGDCAQKNSLDSMRVIGVEIAPDGDIEVLFRAPSINRVGSIETIVGRLHRRMQACWLRLRYR